MTSSPVLVLGSNSFSGASFCTHMLKQEQQVIAVSRSKEPNDALLPYRWQPNQPVFHQLDLNHHLDEIIALIKKHNIKQVYNFAAQSMVGQSWQYPEHWFMTNAVSTIKLHNELNKLDSLDRYIHISTPEVYGSCEGLVPENKNYHPSTLRSFTSCCRYEFAYFRRCISVPGGIYSCSKCVRRRSTVIPDHPSHDTLCITW